METLDLDWEAVGRGVHRLRAVVEEALVGALGGDLEPWHHQCHAASLELVRSGLLPDSARVARGACSGVGGQHSWVALGDPYAPDAPIVDPTLWSYDDAVDGIWIGTARSGRHVPHGGTGSIWTYGRPAPALGPPVELTPTTPLSKDARTFLDLLGPLDRSGWAILSGAPVGGWPAGEILAAMDDTPALRALVPVDRLGMLTDRNPGGLYR